MGCCCALHFVPGIPGRRGGSCFEVVQDGLPHTEGLLQRHPQAVCRHASPEGEACRSKRSKRTKITRRLQRLVSPSSRTCATRHATSVRKVYVATTAVAVRDNKSSSAFTMSFRSKFVPRHVHNTARKKCCRGCTYDQSSQRAFPVTTIW